MTAKFLRLYNEVPLSVDHSGRSRPLLSGSQVSDRVVYVAKSSGFSEQERDIYPRITVTYSHT